MVAPTKIIPGLGLSLDINILQAPGATGDYRTLLTSKASAIASALSAPLNASPNVFVPGKDDKQDWQSGYDFGFLHIKAIDDAGHEKATIFNVKGLECVDQAIGQLAKLLWHVESTGQFHYAICVTGDHSTPVEYGDHRFEPVPFAICWLRDFVSAVGGNPALDEISLDPFRLPTIKSKEDLSEHFSTSEGVSWTVPGGEMMEIVKSFLKL
ncbi:hypothetical protein MLD38_000247 [Melastoma candidum]|uniref:Uncharacterized protein n=1 Tax=Melastoma candidum TaxID=119954 RepID=A0ACB9S9K6_9MYRT|nr:hypothetical protein MLD38_000247 [Melastoma candidum]